MFHEKLTVPLKLDDVHVYVQYDLVPTFIDDHAETNKCLGITTKKIFLLYKFTSVTIIKFIYVCPFSCIFVCTYRVARNGVVF